MNIYTVLVRPSYGDPAVTVVFADDQENADRKGDAFARATFGGTHHFIRTTVEYVATLKGRVEIAGATIASDPQAWATMVSASAALRSCGLHSYADPLYELATGKDTYGG